MRGILKRLLIVTWLGLAIFIGFTSYYAYHQESYYTDMRNKAAKLVDLGCGKKNVMQEKLDCPKLSSEPLNAKVGDYYHYEVERMQAEQK